MQRHANGADQRRRRQFSSGEGGGWFAAAIANASPIAMSRSSSILRPNTVGIGGTLTDNCLQFFTAAVICQAMKMANTR